MREALAAVLERKKHLLPTARNVGIRERTKTLLQEIIATKNVKFAESLVRSIQSNYSRLYICH